MDDLVRWLRAQLDEDERTARAASWTGDANTWHAEPSPYGARNGGQRWYVEDAMDDGVVSHVDPAASDDEGVARHIAEWDPARVLREIDAKRRTLIRCEEAMLSANPMLVHFAKQTAWEMAQPFADRPGYQESWRP
ncbi:DUF6221 family protein [Streptomyces tendae]|uniref:DUF6221 family protein n=1 Tax=Streptomyces tendae TaxID=1932 RepID=UPI00382879DE